MVKRQRAFAFLVFVDLLIASTVHYVLKRMSYHEDIGGLVINEWAQKTFFTVYD